MNVNSKKIICKYIYLMFVKKTLMCILEDGDKYLIFVQLFQVYVIMQIFWMNLIFVKKLLLCINGDTRDYPVQSFWVYLSLEMFHTVKSINRYTGICVCVLAYMFTQLHHWCGLLYVLGGIAVTGVSRCGEYGSLQTEGSYQLWRAQHWHQLLLC